MQGKRFGFDKSVVSKPKEQGITAANPIIVRSVVDNADARIVSQQVGHDAAVIVKSHMVVVKKPMPIFIATQVQ